MNPERTGLFVMAGNIADSIEAKRTQLTIEEQKRKSNCQLKEIDINTILEDHNDLIHPEFTGWHRYQIKRLGKARYCGLASEARRQPVSHKGKLFSRYLKDAQ